MLVGVLALALTGCAKDTTSASPSVAEMPGPMPTSVVVASITTCGDVFANTAIAPIEGTTYATCEPSKPGDQLRSVTATYRVTGDPKAVEAELVNRLGMTPLVFRCCGWEPENPMAAQYTTADGYSVVVSMASGETVERDWSKIAFTVNAQLYLESP